ncbi:unnamed protein product [Spirodela intermedia]|uniref:Uncharacterized protein n=1 Tax=Spirodela intermedia TaxID=51605 RepID=A0A7I8IK60_SPIIN|nr:unnamed protein product [Spirodela intermedia]CAA6658269.1 unnamed protein product [Spirodela intermedia]
MEDISLDEKQLQKFFSELLKKNGVHHRVDTPYHPQTNGQVGRVSGSFILRSAQQEEALHRIWYALRRWIQTRPVARLLRKV